MAWTRDDMAARAARELQDGFYVQSRHRDSDTGSPTIFRPGWK